MKPLRIIQAGLAPLAMVAILACADRPSPVEAPVEDAQFSRWSGSLPKASELTPVVRNVVPSTSPVAMGIIGPSGGSLRRGGVTLTVPAGALSRPVRITMIVPRSPFLQAYFLPHGLKFNQPVSLTWDLSDTSAELPAVASSLVGVYTGLLGGVLSNGTIWGVQETFDADVSDGTATFWTDHFSGYIVASGRGAR